MNVANANLHKKQPMGAQFILLMYTIDISAHRLVLKCMLMHFFKRRTFSSLQLFLLFNTNWEIENQLHNPFNAGLECTNFTPPSSNCYFMSWRQLLVHKAMFLWMVVPIFGNESQRLGCGQEKGVRSEKVGPSYSLLISGLSWKRKYPLFQHDKYMTMSEQERNSQISV